MPIAYLFNNLTHVERAAPKPPNEDDIPPRPEDGASCHGLVIPLFS